MKILEGGRRRTLPPRMFAGNEETKAGPSPFDVIASIDLLNSKVVRLTRGDFASVREYGDAEEVLDSLQIPAGARLHVVDLEGSRSGQPIETAVVKHLAERNLRVQVGGGIRALRDADEWLACGVEKLVVGTVAADAPELLRDLVAEFGQERIIAAVDVRGGIVRVGGWERDSTSTLSEVVARIQSLGIREVLVTDIARDGALHGPSFALYRELGRLNAASSSLRLIASGGVTSIGDVVSLARLGNVGSCVIGKALLEHRFTLREAMARVTLTNAIPERIIPCLDVRDGRVVKGTRFENIRDSGDPVECARRYESEGADELVLLDITATDSDRQTSLEVVHSVSEALFIPLTVGGGVRSIEDFRALLRAGADRVAINTAALQNPQLIADCAREFGVQAVVLSCDAKRIGTRFEPMMRSGKEASGIDAVDWCKRAEELGAGEILLTSVDRDGTQEGFDLELLRAVTSRVRIGVIASGGAGKVDDFRDAIESGGARAVLAASLFHDRVLSISDVKRFLAGEGIPVR